MSCGTSDHPSWDRACLVFLHKCQEYSERLEGNCIPYFPTLEAWTQIKEYPRTVFLAEPRGLPAAPNWLLGASDRLLSPGPTMVYPIWMPPHTRNSRIRARVVVYDKNLVTLTLNTGPQMSSTLGPTLVRLKIWQQNLNKSRAALVLPQLQAGSFFKLIISGSIKMLKMCEYS